MIELFRAGPQARKVRFMMLFSWACALGACWAGLHLFRSGGPGPAVGAAFAPSGARTALGLAIAFSGLGFAAAMALFGRLYVRSLHVDRNGGMVRIRTLGLFGKPQIDFAVADLERSTFFPGELVNPHGVSVNAPWYRLRVKGRRWPFILDAQGLSDEPERLRNLLEAKAGPPAAR